MVSIIEGVSLGWQEIAAVNKVGAAMVTPGLIRVKAL
jgi:hypothetical protein